MAFEFLLEIQKSTPKFSSRVLKQDEILISPSIIKETASVKNHEDRIYNSKTQRCQELDCSEFYTTAVTTGKVAQCGDCLPKRTKTTYTKPFGCSQWNLLSRYLYDATFVKPPRISNASTYQDYIDWFTEVPGQEQLKQFLAKSGYWLGLHPCNGKSWQCLVDCAGGEVGGCWDSGAYGSANIGLVYQIGESSYQVYDPVQILLAGLTPPGGSFPLLSGNPLTGLTANAGNPADEDYEGCGRPFTILEDARSCLVSTGKPTTCEEEDEEYQPQEDMNPAWENKAIAGDFGGKSILSQGECYLAPTQSVIMNSWSLSGSLGGTLDIGRFDDPPLLIDQVIENCGACISKLVEDGKGPGCCPISHGAITIRDAPIWNGTSWGLGGETWNNFWDDSIPDGGFRNDNNCADPSIPSTCSWSSDCDGPETGDLANGIGTIPCSSSFKPSSCGRNTEVVQVGHYEYLSCDGGVGAVAPILLEGCDACDGVSAIDCYSVYQCQATGCTETNPYGHAHRISRNKNDSNDAGQPPSPEEDCGFSASPGCFGVAFLICEGNRGPCNNSYVPTCCSETQSSINSTGEGSFNSCSSQTFGSSSKPPLTKSNCEEDDDGP